MKFKCSIRKKTITLIILLAATLSAVSMLVCSSIITNITDENCRTQATEFADTVAHLIDADKFVRVRDMVLSIYNSTPTEERVDCENYDGREAVLEQYIAQFESVSDDSDYKDIAAFLRKIRNLNNIENIYTVYVDKSNKYKICIVDSAEDNAYDPGTLYPVYEADQALLSDPENGFPARITNTGASLRRVTAGVPIHDGDGNVAGYVMCDISTEYMRHKQIGHIMRLLTFLIVTTILICVLGVILINIIFVKPIVLLSETARSYCSIDDSDDDGNEGRNDPQKHKGRQVFSKLNIHTGDEIEDLANSMIQMENDINDQINSIISMNSELSDIRQYADEMSEIANKDSLTGLRNKNSYDNEILQLEQKIENNDAEFGIVISDLNDMKKINDTYGHEAGNAAIISLGKIICNIFVHSPVFRIGGDEFAIIIRNNDYKNIKALISEFMETINAISRDTSLHESERISAAIGYALYSKDTDSNVVDVFRRADHEMYVCKRYMKENNAQSFMYGQFI